MRRGKTNRPEGLKLPRRITSLVISALICLGTLLPSGASSVLATQASAAGSSYWSFDNTTYSEIGYAYWRYRNFGTYYSDSEILSLIGDTYYNRKDSRGNYRTGYSSGRNRNNSYGYDFGFYYGDDLLYFAEVRSGSPLRTQVKLYFWDGLIVGCRDYRGNDSSLYSRGSRQCDAIAREFYYVYDLGDKGVDVLKGGGTSTGNPGGNGGYSNTTYSEIGQAYWNYMNNGTYYSDSEILSLIGDTYRNRKDSSGNYRTGYSSGRNKNNSYGYDFGFYYGDNLLYFAEVRSGSPLKTWVKLYFWDGEIIGCRDYRGSDSSLYSRGSRQCNAIAREFYYVYALGAK